MTTIARNVSVENLQAEGDFLMNEKWKIAPEKRCLIMEKPPRAEIIKGEKCVGARRIDSPPILLRLRDNKNISSFAFHYDVNGNVD